MMEAGYRYVPHANDLGVKPSLCIRALKYAQCVVNTEAGIRVVRAPLAAYAKAPPVEHHGRPYPIKQAAAALLAMTKRPVAKRDITKEAREYLQRILDDGIVQEEVKLEVNFLPDMTGEEIAVAEKLRAEGRDPGYIRGFLLVGRKGQPVKKRSRTVKDETNGGEMEQGADTTATATEVPAKPKRVRKPKAPKAETVAAPEAAAPDTNNETNAGAAAGETEEKTVATKKVKKAKAPKAKAAKVAKAPKAAKAKKAKGTGAKRVYNDPSPESKIGKAVAYMRAEVKKGGGQGELERGYRKALLERTVKKFSVAPATAASCYAAFVRHYKG